ncbi:uncharacterized protein LOC107044238 [Diachasma alloeum]|uniref:uncharacterized protein LOC107044238 n=1 Tax=Diachasma alloeum TaxID=454923 RepID=UPI0007381379|nr:uncharacterized protein LOC107044238 [Diachasma alloeum]
MLETYWAKLEASHEKLVGQKIENLTSLDYFKNQVFDVALKHYASAHLDQLLNPAPMKTHGASNLNLLTSFVSEALSALKALDQPTDHWGPIVVHVLTRRLSSKLREAWENKIGASTEYPTLEHLLDFLQGRSRAMETLEVGSSVHTSNDASRPSQPSVQTRSMTKSSAKVNQASVSSHAQQSAQKSPSPAQIQSTKSTSWADAGYPCSYCKMDHYIASCSGFKSLTPTARKKVVERLYLCYNCLGKHSIRVCKTTRSELSLISDQLVRKVNLKKTRSSVHITGVGGSSFGTTTGEVHLTLQSIHSEERIEVTAHSLERLTSTLPSFSAEGLKWDHIEGLELADPHFRVSAPIDLLVGANIFGQVIKPNVIRGGVQAPVAQLTSFGWIVYGPAGPDQPTSYSSHHLSVSNDELNDLLTKFWVQEEVPGRTDANLSTEELECERHFHQTHSRDSSGRYVVRLPFSAPVLSLGNSYRPVLACLHRMLAGISKDAHFLQLYSDFLKEYEDFDHMRVVTRSTHRSSSSVQADSACRSDETTLAHEAQASGGLRVSKGFQVGPSDAQRSYYLPHHGVVRESSETTKLRVVFNGSAKTSSGNSLNDILHTGAKLQRDISDVLLWSRQHKVIFMTDITKMFRHVRVHKDDWPLQQILWTDSSGELVTYQLTTVTYGTRSAPFLANRVLLQLAEDEGHRFPLAVSPIVKGRYVDDICGGADTHDQLVRTAQEVRDLCAAGGMPLAKWHSNNPALLQWLAPDSASNDQGVYEDSETRILGLSWQPSSGNFIFSSRTSDESKVSKRNILSEIAQIYDPLGFLSPVVIRGKLLMQETWIGKLGWDEEVPEQVAQRWKSFRNDLTLLSKLSVPLIVPPMTSEFMRIRRPGFLACRGSPARITSSSQVGPAMNRRFLRGISSQRSLRSMTHSDFYLLS